jgi:hypothetical protein
LKQIEEGGEENYDNDFDEDNEDTDLAQAEELGEVLTSNKKKVNRSSNDVK